MEVAAPDLPGHGDTPGDPLPTIEAVAGWLADQPRTGPSVFVGHSLGALSSIEVAASHPELVGGLVLVGAASAMIPHPSLLAAAGDDLGRAARLIAGWSMPRAHLGGHPEPGTWEGGGIVRMVERSRPRVLETDLKACSVYAASIRAGKVSAPTLLVSGAEDRMAARRGADDLASALAGARHETMPGAGHQPMIQHPTRFNRLLGAFLAA